MQHVHSATRARGLDTPRVINLIITGTQDIIEENEMCSPLGKSDHVVLKINWKINSYVQEDYTGKLNYTKGNYDKLREYLDIDWVDTFNNFGTRQWCWQKVGLSQKFNLGWTGRWMDGQTGGQATTFVVGNMLIVNQSHKVELVSDC